MKTPITEIEIIVNKAYRTAWIAVRRGKLRWHDYLTRPSWASVRRCQRAQLKLAGVLKDEAASETSKA